MMQKVLINCQTLQKDDIFHILKVNNYHPIEFDNENQGILLLELYDYQINLLTKLMHNYSQNQQHEVFVCVCHKISFYG